MTAGFVHPLALCEAPVGEGQLLASGSIVGLRTTPAYDLTFTARGVPLDAISALARHSKKNFWN